LHICAKREADVLVESQVTADQEVAGRVVRGYPVGLWESIEPEDGVGDETDNKQTREGAERKQGVGTTRAVFNGADGAFDFGHMFVGATGVERREKRTECFEFGVGQNGGDAKAAVVIESENGLETIPNGGVLAVGNVLDGHEFEVTRGGNQERELIDKHDVDSQGDVAMAVYDGERHWVDAGVDVWGRTGNGFAFEAT
jgi:hypothetical protein